MLILLLRNSGAPGQTVSQVPIGVVGPHLLCPPPLVTSQSRVATTSGPELIFVTNITNYICGEKSVMSGGISDFCKEFEQFMEFSRNLLLISAFNDLMAE